MKLLRQLVLNKLKSNRIKAEVVVRFTSPSYKIVFVHLGKNPPRLRTVRKFASIFLEIFEKYPFDLLDWTYFSREEALQLLPYEFDGEAEGFESLREALDPQNSKSCAKA